MFLDSTLARFWVKDAKLKKKLIKKLESFKNEGHFLRLDFSNNRYGDIVFLANPGVLIFPNFYQKAKPVKAMHGYDPNFPDQKGLYISTSGKERKDLEMRELPQLSQ